VKIAALYDIHGNLPALDAVLKDIESIQPDVIVVGGDIVSGPMPRQTLERLRQGGERVACILSVAMGTARWSLHVMARSLTRRCQRKCVKSPPGLPNS